MNRALSLLLIIFLFVVCLSPLIAGNGKRGDGIFPLFDQQIVTPDTSYLSDVDSEKVYNLDQVVITATRTQKQSFQVPREVIVVKQQDMAERNIKNTPDALMETPSILVQKTNYGGGAPVIRGLIGNQVLILVDGIRLNNSTFRYGPNQYLNTISPGLLEQIEVVEGPGSILYGSDALGGTINLISRSPRTGQQTIVQSTTTLSSADHSFVEHLDYQAGIMDNLSLSVGGGYQKFNDLSSARGYQRPTGYRGYDGYGKMNYSLSSSQCLSLAYQFTEQQNVPRTDRVVAGTDIKYLFNPQRRELAYGVYEGSIDGSFINKVKMTLSYNHQREGRQEITIKNPSIETQDIDETNTYGASMVLNSYLDPSNFLTYGFEYYHDKVNSQRKDVTLATGASTSKRAQFPDGSTYQTFGAFIQDEWSLDPLSLIGGVRYSAFKFRGTVDTSLGETISTPNDFTMSLHGAYALLNEQLHLIAGISQGFRAPNLDDLAVFGKSGSGAGARYDIPNTNLNPEKSLNYEAGAKYRSRTLLTSLFYFYSDFTDLIIPKPSSHNGSDSISHTRVYQRFNVGKANIQGISASCNYVLFTDLLLKGEVSWTLGQNTSDNEPLSRIPPFRGIVSARYTQPDYWVEYYNLFASYQKRLSASDIKDARIGPNGTPGYVTFNLRGGYVFSPNFRATLTYENILNRLYKMHGSGVYSPGTNVIASLLVSI